MAAPPGAALAVAAGAGAPLPATLPPLKDVDTSYANVGMLVDVSVLYKECPVLVAEQDLIKDVCDRNVRNDIVSRT